MTNDAQAVRPLKSLLILCTIAFFCVISGYFITPQLLIFLGPMQQSLTSDIESVRRIAYFEVVLLKALLYILAVLLIVAVIAWKRVVDSGFVQLINAHEPLESDRNITFNLSFLIILCCLAVGILYMKVGPQVFTSTQLNMINSECGVIENLTVLFIIIAFLFSVVLLFKFPVKSERFIVHCVLALVFFLMAGEEISWGQHFFDPDKSMILDSVNVQREANFHNILGYFADHFFIAGIFIYGFVAPFFVHFSIFAGSYLIFLEFQLPHWVWQLVFL